MAASRLTCVLGGRQGCVRREQQQQQGEHETPAAAATALHLVMVSAARRHPGTPAAHATPRPHLEKVKKRLVNDGVDGGWREVLTEVTMEEGTVLVVDVVTVWVVKMVLEVAAVLVV